MKHRQLAYALLRFTLPTVVVVVAVLLLLHWRMPTRVRVDLTVDRAVFTVEGADATPVLNAVGFRSLTVEKFARIVFHPTHFEVADPAQYILAEDRYPESAWTSLPVASPVEITGEDATLLPAVTLESTRVGLEAVGRLDRIWA